MPQTYMYVKIKYGFDETVGSDSVDLITEISNKLLRDFNTAGLINHTWSSKGSNESS